jgi:hypothetical protein
MTLFINGEQVDAVDSSDPLPRGAVALYVNGVGDSGKGAASFSNLKVTKL